MVDITITEYFFWKEVRSIFYYETESTEYRTVLPMKQGKMSKDQIAEIVGRSKYLLRIMNANTKEYSDNLIE